MTEQVARHSIPETGNPFLDASHQRLMALGDTIRDTWRAGGDAQAFLAGIEAFREAVIEHFGQEELILKAIRFDSTQNHHHNHKAIFEMLEQAISRLHHAWEVGTVARVVELMEDILLCHELVDDNDFIDVLHAHGDGVAEGCIVAWDSALSTGDPGIDQGHKDLILSLNALYRLCLADNADQVAAALDAFDAQICRHFEEEEAVLAASDTGPSDADHRAKHAMRHKQMQADFRRAVRYCKETALPVKVMVEGYLRFWLLNHIRCEDVPEFLARLHR